MATIVIPSPQELQDFLHILTQIDEQTITLSAKATIAYKHHADERGMKAVEKLRADISKSLEQLRNPVLFWLMVSQLNNRKGDHKIRLLETVRARKADIEEVEQIILEMMSGDENGSAGNSE